METRRISSTVTIYTLITWISGTVFILLCLSASTNYNLERKLIVSGRLNIHSKTTIYSTPDHRPFCIIEEEELEGRKNVTKEPYSFEYLLELHSDGEDNGRFQPEHCRSPQTVAIIVPYRDRTNHLKVFLYNLIPKLKRQKIDFTIYLIEQAMGTPFNRGMMRNIGFIEAEKIRNYDCYIFNDVDTIPENDRNLYLCDHGYNVKHLVTAVDRQKYTLPYNWLVGGIVALTKAQFYRVNGYSNLYFVWGAEDDDLSRRITKSGMKIVRPEKHIGPITTLRHTRDPVLEKRMQLFRLTANNSHIDGLNSLRYRILFTDNRKLYTWIYVKINQTEITNSTKLIESP